VTDEPQRRHAAELVGQLEQLGRGRLLVPDIGDLAAEQARPVDQAANVPGSPTRRATSTASPDSASTSSGEPSIGTHRASRLSTSARARLSPGPIASSVCRSSRAGTDPSPSNQIVAPPPMPSAAVVIRGTEPSATASSNAATNVSAAWETRPNRTCAEPSSSSRSQRRFRSSGATSARCCSAWVSSRTASA
jgi:hypothetical protein